MNAPVSQPLLRAWLAFNAACVASGWVLSAAGLLVPAAWAVVMGLFFVGSVAAWRGGLLPRPRWGRVRRRFTRPAAAVFALLFLASLVGGTVHEPNNIDALAYRTPRVLHWLAEHQWHWIHAPYQRLNTRACGFEWTTAPFLSLCRSDRPLFLLNLAAFALLPGLVFTTLRRLGLGGRAAATWMWLFPGAYCFALQAGSIGNDLHGAALALAALALALRARDTRSARDAAWSLLAAGLMTGAKSSNLPLLLPWIVAWWPGARLLFRRPVLLVAAGLLAAGTSLLPVCVLNQRFAGDWTGLKAEDAWIRPPGPVASALHNTGLMAVQNLLPPILPGARALNEAVERALPESWKASLDGFAENGRHSYAVREIPGEEHAGLGFGVSVLLLLQLGHGLRRGGLRRLAPTRWHAAVLLLPLVAFGPYFARSGITTAGRILAPYYGFVLPALLLAGRAESAVRTRWFRAAVPALGAVALVLVVLLPTRPLWPARTVLSRLAGNGGPAARAFTVYDVYARRADHFAPLKAWIPDHPGTLGLVTGNDAETPLWKPYGTRRVRHFLPGDDPGAARNAGMTCLVANREEFTARFGTDPATWAARNGATVAGSAPLKLLASQPAQEFVVLRWDPPSPAR